MKIAIAALGILSITGCAGTAAHTSAGAGSTSAIVKPPAIAMPDRINSDISLASLDEIDRMRIARTGLGNGAVRVCAAPSGRVSSAQIVRSTGNARFDSVLVSQIRGWTYQPYKPTYGAQVCETVRLDYHG